ncbi:hypothetical protein [Hydrogenimonas sp.]
MIHGLTPLSAAQKTLLGLSKIEVNALLQLGIEVLKARNDGTYLIKLGQHTFTTKSDQPLEPGREYWAQMRQSKGGVIHLQRLMPKPAMLKMADSLSFDLALLENLAKKKDPAGGFRDHLLHQMAAATTKDSFQNLTQLLMSLHQGVVSLPIKEQGRPMLLQMRKKRQNRDLNQKSVEFYAAMSNIGPLVGVIIQTGSRKDLKLFLHYSKSIELLERNKESLHGFATVAIEQSPAAVKPFWDGEKATLLDIKG